MGGGGKPRGGTSLIAFPAPERQLCLRVRRQPKEANKAPLVADLRRPPVSEIRRRSGDRRAHHFMAGGGFEHCGRLATLPENQTGRSCQASPRAASAA